jgi:hypothetical protein
MVAGVAKALRNANISVPSKRRSAQFSSLFSIFCAIKKSRAGV